MRRTYLTRRSNALFTPESFSWGLVALGIVLMLLLVRFLAPNFFWSVFSPLYGGAAAVATASHMVVSSFSDVAELQKKNDELAAQYAALAVENRALGAKLKALSELVAAPSAAKSLSASVLAGVVARPPESPYDTLVLSGGSDAGIAAGMEVFGAGGVPLGVITSVLPQHAHAMLFSAPQAITHGWVGEAHTPLTIMGLGGGVMHATAARAAQVAVGDVVYAPGPGALPVGSVIRIDGDPAAPEVVLRITPAINIFSVTWVLVRDTGFGGATKALSATSTAP